MNKPDDFWLAMDSLIATTEMIIDRPKGSRHPRYPECVYAVDYGYLAGTTAMDGQGIDVWLGSDTARQLDAILCTVDLLKRDAEIKLLIGCTEEEKQTILDNTGNSPSMKGILVRRNPS